MAVLTSARTQIGQSRCEAVPVRSDPGGAGQWPGGSCDVFRMTGR